MIAPQWFFVGLLIPVLLGVIGALFHRPWLTTLAVGAAFVVGFFAVFDAPWAMNAWEAHDWLAITVLPMAIVVGLLDSVRRVPVWCVWVVRVVIALLLSPLLLRSYLQYAGEPWAAWGVGEAGVWVTAIALIAIMWWALLRQLICRWGGRTFVVALAILSMGIGIVTAASAYQTLGQVCISLAACLGGLALTANRETLRGRGWLDTVIVMMLGLLIVARFYAPTLTNTMAALLLLSALAPWIMAWPRLRKLPGVSGAGGRLVLVVVLVVAAIALAGYERTAGSDEDSGGELLYDYSSMP